MNLLKGASIAQKIREEVASDVGKLKARGIHPHLAFIVPPDDSGAAYYGDAQKRACEKDLWKDTEELRSNLVTERREQETTRRRISYLAGGSCDGT